MTTKAFDSDLRDVLRGRHFPAFGELADIYAVDGYMGVTYRAVAGLDAARRLAACRGPDLSAAWLDVLQWATAQIDVTV